jgi:hypothetical protein
LSHLNLRKLSPDAEGLVLASIDRLSHCRQQAPLIPSRIGFGVRTQRIFSLTGIEGHARGKQRRERAIPNPGVIKIAHFQN